MAYPSVISVITNPQASDRLNSPSHSSIHQATNAAITEIETFVGTLSSVAGTLVNDIRSASSNGGGHVQTANKGGTGQTAYTKGDLLVAMSTSVLSKLSIGTDGQAPIADSSASTGISWQGVLTAATVQNQTNTYARASVMSASVYGIKLANTPSVLTDGMGFVVKFPTANITSVLALSVFTQSGSVAALMKYPSLANIAVGGIQASMVGVVEFESVSSVFQLVTQPAPVALGTWASASTNSNVQATTDGILVGWQAASGGAPTTTISTDSSSTPTTNRVLITGNTTIPFTVPVRKNDYYNITTGGGATVTAFFIPLGT